MGEGRQEGGGGDGRRGRGRGGRGGEGRRGKRGWRGEEGGGGEVGGEEGVGEACISSHVETQRRPQLKNVTIALRMTFGLGSDLRDESGPAA